jgi:hypothetical protein
MGLLAAGAAGLLMRISARDRSSLAFESFMATDLRSSSSSVSPLTMASISLIFFSRAATRSSTGARLRSLSFIISISDSSGLVRLSYLWWGGGWHSGEPSLIIMNYSPIIIMLPVAAVFFKFLSLNPTLMELQPNTPVFRNVFLNPRSGAFSSLTVRRVEILEFFFHWRRKGIT